MARSKENRGPSPTKDAILKLCVAAAGRCQFPGCNEYLFREAITMKDLVYTNIAHVVASSPNGPRGDQERSHALSAKEENLILRCPKHHKLIDANASEYSEAQLLDMKQAHVKAIFEHCNLITKQSTEIIRFTSPIKGKTHVDVAYTQVVDAVVPEKRPASAYGQYLNICISADYHSREYWDEAERQIDTFYNCCIRSITSSRQDACFSVFPIAPIPLIIKLGYIMGDKIPIDIFQKTRIPDTWKWVDTAQTNSFEFDKKEVRDGEKVALILSLTADIAQERVSEVLDADVIYRITAKRFGVDCIKSPLDLVAFWHKYQETCDDIRNTYTDVKEACVFPAIPVSAAFEIGRRYMPGIYPTLKIFDDDQGFFETLSVGRNGK